jgi:TonB-linked SusC/RagA family outer membrane protein
MYKIYLQHLVLPPGCTKKILRVMKLTTLIMLIALLQVSASTLAQKVTLSATNAPISAIFNQIEKQTGYDFAFTGKILDKAKPVTINVKNEELADVLKQIFDGQPLDYKIEDKSVTVSVKQPTVFDKIKNYFAAMDVTGRVTDENNQPLSGATVQVKDGNNSTITDVNGFFTLKHVQSNATLVISFIGFDKKEVPAAPNIGTVKLAAATSPLDEVKVIAYGQTTERLSVGNINSVTAKEIEKQPISNPLIALEGRVPGLSVTQVNGLPGSGVKIQLQGSKHSFTGGNDPLFVIDGVPFTSYLLPNIGNIMGAGSNSGNNTQAGFGNPLNYINPSDIESISVLKDADATAIYGSRAANGAILITTKKGKSGPVKANFDLQQGVGNEQLNIKLMNTQQYLQLRHEMFKNSGRVPRSSDYDINGTWDTTRYTNWQKVLLGGTANYTNLNGDISGGNNNIQFLLGGTYHRETTVFPGGFADQKGSLNFNLNGASDNKRFKFQFSGTYLVDDNHLPQIDLTSRALTLPPDAPALFNADGSLNWAPSGASLATWGNPLAAGLYQTYQNKTNNLISNLQLDYQILPGLNIKSSMGYTSLQQDEITLNPLISYTPVIRSFITPSAAFSYNNINTWIIEPQITYQRKIGNGQLQTILGGTFEQNNYNGLILNGSGYSSDLTLGSTAAATSLTSSNTISTYKYTALFGRVNYNWQQKYIIDLTFRRDGSSRFGAANQFANFGSVGAGWIFSEENLFKNHLSFLSFGKLKASYGTTGNDQIGDYAFMSLYFPVTVDVPYRGVSALTPSGLTNPYLEWELTKKINAGVDLGFLKDHILFSANYFRNRSSNQLLGYNLPVQTGFTSITRNFPATIENSGIELSLTTVNIKNKSFSWSTNINVTLPISDAKLIAFNNLATSTYASFYQVGKSVSGRLLYHYEGVNPTSGLYQFSDGKGGQTSAPQTLPYSTVATSFVNPNPTFYGGINNNFHYKDFELSFLFQFSRQMTQNYFFGFNGQLPGVFLTNQPVDVLNHWMKPGDIATYQRIAYSTNSAAANAQRDILSSDAIYTNLLFIRMQNLSFAWNIPQGWCDKTHLRNIQFNIRGQNLFTINHSYFGFNPENGLTGIMPLKIITLGLRVGL